MLKKYKEFLSNILINESTDKKEEKKDVAGYDEEAFKIISEAFFYLKRYHPFFIDIITKMRVKEHKSLPYKTMATDGVHLFYDPDYVKKIGDKKVVWTIAHEIMHNVAGHFLRTPTIKDQDEFTLWNMAADYAINTYLDGIGVMPEHSLYDAKYKEMTAEEIFISLKPSPIVTLSSFNPAISEGKLPQGSTRNTLYMFMTDVKVFDAFLTELTFNTFGNHTPSDALKYQLWCADSTNPNNCVLISEITKSLGKGSHLFTNINIKIPNGCKFILWITADIAMNSKLNNTIGVNAIESNDLNFSAAEILGTTYNGIELTIVPPEEQQGGGGGEGEDSQEEKEQDGQGTGGDSQDENGKGTGGGNGKETQDESGTEKSGGNGGNKGQDKDIKDIPKKDGKTGTTPGQEGFPGEKTKGESAPGKPGKPGKGFGVDYNKEGEWTIIIRPGDIDGGASTPLDPKGGEEVKTDGGVTIKQTETLEGYSPEELAEKWKEIAKTAADLYPSGSALLDILIGRFCRGNVDWKSVLQDILRSALWQLKKLIPYRRFAGRGLYLAGPKTKPSGFHNAVVCVDTSGSIVSNYDLMSKMFDEIYEMCYDEGESSIETIHVVYADDLVRKVETYDEDNPLKFEKMEPRGGGGTDFRPACEWINKQIQNEWDEEPAFVVYLTDGDGNFPDYQMVREFEENLIWIIYADDPKNAPVGKSIYIPSKVWATKTR